MSDFEVTKNKKYIEYITFVPEKILQHHSDLLNKFKILFVFTTPWVYHPKHNHAAICLGDLRLSWTRSEESFTQAVRSQVWDE